MSTRPMMDLARAAGTQPAGPACGSRTAPVYITAAARVRIQSPPTRAVHAPLGSPHKSKPGRAPRSGQLSCLAVLLSLPRTSSLWGVKFSVRPLRRSSSIRGCPTLPVCSRVAGAKSHPHADSHGDTYTLTSKQRHGDQQPGRPGGRPEPLPEDPHACQGVCGGQP